MGRASVDFAETLESEDRYDQTSQSLFSLGVAQARRYESTRINIIIGTVPVPSTSADDARNTLIHKNISRY